MLTLLLFGCGFLASALRLDLPGSLALISFCVVTVGCVAFRRPVAACAILGALTPILPAFGSGTLLAAGFFLLISIGHRRLEPWTLPFLGIVAIDVLGQMALDPDPFVAATFWGPAAGKGAAFLAWLGSSPPRWLLSLQLFTRLALLSAIASAFREDTRGRAYESGLLIGAGAAIPVVFFQAAGSLEGVLPNQTSLWTHQDRFGGTFTDPNAMGIFAALLIPILWNRLALARGTAQRFASFLLLCGWLAAALFTGSRAFLLGMIFYLLALCWARTRLVFFSLVATFIASVAFLNWAERTHPDATSEILTTAPAGVQRLADTLSAPRIREALFSRTLFYRMGADMWLDRPIAGAGFGRFAEVLPHYLEEAHVDIGGWTDNSNNFYLGVLAELGLVGLFALALSVASIRRNGPGDARRSALWCLAILLLVGPHIDFDEVALVVGFLFAVSTVSSQRGRANRLALTVVGLAAALAFTSRTASSSLGFHGWERNGAAPFRWSGRRAAFTLGCGEGQEAHLRIQASNPDIAEHPLTVVLDGPCGLRSVQISDTAPYDIPLPCGCDGRGSSRYTLEASRSWSPHDWKGFGPDRRLLGVQVYTGSGLDLVR